nr:MAG TPA: hypothetical protein [Caudoviricetes sp.]
MLLSICNIQNDKTPSVEALGATRAMFCRYITQRFNHVLCTKVFYQKNLK